MRGKRQGTRGVMAQRLFNMAFAPASVGAKWHRCQRPRTQLGHLGFRGVGNQCQQPPIVNSLSPPPPRETQLANLRRSHRPEYLRTSSAFHLFCLAVDRMSIGILADRGPAALKKHREATPQAPNRGLIVFGRHILANQMQNSLVRIFSHLGNRASRPKTPDFPSDVSR